MKPKMQAVSVRKRTGPIVLAFPHSGTYVPKSICAQLNHRGQNLSDTDWHVDRLYRGLLPSATIIKANFHRYVIDANRDPEGTSLYPGQNTTELCPLTDFDGQAIYIKAMSPGPSEIAARCAAFHQPYHQAISQEISRLQLYHEHVLLYDCHSIRPRVPFLFSGQLPDFNIGSNDGRTCQADLQAIVAYICGQATGYSMVENGRFKGGWTTRHYGKPKTGVHALQMELSQLTYMDADGKFTYNREKAKTVRRVLRTVLTHLEAALQ